MKKNKREFSPCVADFTTEIHTKVPRDVLRRFRMHDLEKGYAQPEMGLCHNVARRLVVTEKIIAAAVRYEGMTFSLLPPARHGECILLMLACRQDIDRDKAGPEWRIRFVCRRTCPWCRALFRPQRKKWKWASNRCMIGLGVRLLRTESQPYR